MRPSGSGCPPSTAAGSCACDAWTQGHVECCHQVQQCIRQGSQGISFFLSPCQGDSEEVVDSGTP